MKHKKKGLIKQVTRFKMHKSGKFWVVSSLTQFSWLNLSKKTVRQVKVKVDEEVDNDVYQRLFVEDDPEPNRLGQGVKIFAGLAAGLGVGLVGEGLIGNRVSAEEVGIEKQQTTDTLAQKDSIAIKLVTSESVSENTASSLSESESVSDSLSLQSDLESETDPNALVTPFSDLENYEQTQTGQYTYFLKAQFDDNLLGHAQRNIEGDIDTRSGNFNGKAWNDGVPENGLTDDFKITLKTDNGEYLKWSRAIGGGDILHLGVDINFSFVDELYAPGAGETFEVTFHVNGANHTFVLPNSAYIESGSASDSLSETESISQSVSNSDSGSISDSEWPSQSISDSESSSDSESTSESTSSSDSGSISDSEWPSQSTSDSESSSDSVSVSDSDSESASESTSSSDSGSISDSEWPSQSTSDSESTSESTSSSDSGSISDSEWPSQST
ncbi:KxYKxGKxW signal peptide domain-containing protein, partial [Lactococcus sp. DD01]|uniref:KxYKxGKxW signal peptide domain-containing protein n=1 Tax=Lactococcus sp. DD01 TaxID=1776443 RepID=UPI0018D36B56